MISLPGITKQPDHQIRQLAPSRIDNFAREFTDGQGNDAGWKFQGVKGAGRALPSPSGNWSSEKAEGNIDILAELAQTLVNFQIGFDILPGTAGEPGDIDLNPYAVAEDSIQVSGE